MFNILTAPRPSSAEHTRSAILLEVIAKVRPDSLVFTVRERFFAGAIWKEIGAQVRRQIIANMIAVFYVSICDMNLNFEMKGPKLFKKVDPVHRIYVDENQTVTVDSLRLRGFVPATANNNLDLVDTVTGWALALYPMAHIVTLKDRPSVTARRSEIYACQLKGLYKENRNLRR